MRPAFRVVGPACIEKRTATAGASADLVSDVDRSLHRMLGLGGLISFVTSSGFMSALAIVIAVGS